MTGQRGEGDQFYVTVSVPAGVLLGAVYAVGATRVWLLGHAGDR